MAGRWGTGTPQRPVTVTRALIRASAGHAHDRPNTVRLDLTPRAVSLSARQYVPFPIRKATTMATSTDTTPAAPTLLDGVITTRVSLFACRVPNSEDHERGYDTADRLMKVANNDPELAVRIALSRALECATGPDRDASREYLQAALAVVHNYGHPTHRKA